ncbi:MAG: hypothetical protein N2517_06615 [Ignavibacteria bacterium]|nr:hypothetical protein [Ignavibacteria bacterium]
MSNSNVKALILVVFAFILALQEAFAQPAIRARERVSEFKKLKLLDILELDEKTSEKFLAKYNAQEKVVKEKHEKLQENMLDLEYLLRKKASKDEIAKQTQKVLDAQKDFANAMFDLQKEIRGILDDIQFAKFILFENRFRTELQRMIIEKAKRFGGDEKPRRKQPRDFEFDEE